MKTIRISRGHARPIVQAALAAMLLFSLDAAAFAQEGAGTEPLPANGAALHGRVTDLQGQPLFGVVVFTSRMDAPSGAALVLGRAQTGFDGSFSITGMTPGTYRLCMDPQGKEYLDPCEWSEVPVTVQLEASGVLRDLDIQVETAETVSIEVDDETDALAKLADPEAITKPKPSGALILGLRTRTGNLARARLAVTDRQAKKLRYTVAAPKNEDLDVVLMPVNLDLKDNDNRILAERGTVIRLSKEEKAQKPKEEPIIAVKLAKKGQ